MIPTVQLVPQSGTRCDRLNLIDWTSFKQSPPLRWLRLPEQN
jgi:hypothetical protein